MIAAALWACVGETTGSKAGETSDTGLPIDPHAGPEFLLEEAAVATLLSERMGEYVEDVSCGGDGRFALGIKPNSGDTREWDRVAVHEGLPTGAVGISSAARWTLVGTFEDPLDGFRVLLPGDLDGDGHPDVVSRGKRWSLAGVPDVTRPDGILPDHGGAWLAGDADADGVPDLWVAGGDPLQTTWALVSGASFLGEIEPGADLVDSPAQRTGGQESFQIAPDLTGDGADDAVYEDHAYGVAILSGPFVGLPRDALSRALTLSLPDGTRVREVVVADLDEDGAADLVAGLQEVGTPSRVVALFGPIGEERTLSTPDLVLEGEVVDGLFAEVAAGDLDGDGHVDLAVGAPAAGPGTVTVFPGPFEPGYRSAADAPLVYVGTSRYDGAGGLLRACDLDGDGAAELLVGASRAGVVYVVHGGPLAP